MKSIILKSFILSIVMVGAISCKNNSNEPEPQLEAPAEASDVAVEYSIDTDASTIKWEGNKPTATHYGKVKLSSGVLLVHDNEIEAGKFEIDLKTITVEDLEGEHRTNLENHLMGTIEGKEGDFFDVNKYPTASFELTGIEDNAVMGNLTIKEKTLPIKFPATVEYGDNKLTLKSEQFELDRTQWGINYGSKSIFPNLGDKFVSDVMKISISLEAQKI